MKIMRISLAIAAWLVIPAGLSAQVYLPTGFPRFGTFAPSSFDTVNAANLNVNFSIPVLKKAGRGIPFNYIFTYNSSVWSPQSSSGANQWSPTPGFGWNMEGDLLGDSFSRQSVFFGSASYQETQQNCTPPPPYGQETFDVYGPWFYSDPDGTTRRFVVYVDDKAEMAPDCIGDPHPSPAHGGAEDGSGWAIVASINTSNNPTAQFTSPSGWQYQPALAASPYLKDTNGNQVSEATQNGHAVLVDTLGQDALTFTSFSQYSYPNAAGGTSSVTIGFTTYTVRTNFGCSGVAEFGPTSESLVTEIDLPDDNPNGTRDRYLIDYEQNTDPLYSGDYTGRIASVTLPTGGKIIYTYSGGNNDVNCADGSTNTLTRTTPDGAWSYVHTVGTGSNYWTWTTNITDPAPFSDQTIMNFQGMYETERKVYQGSSTLLETVDTCYSGASIPCTGTYPVTPISSRTVQTTVPGVSPSETYTTYNSTNNLPTEVDEYDWGPTLARKTLTTYDYNTSCGISSGSSITDHPCSVNIENSSGTIQGPTSNTYDSNGNLKSVTSGGLTISFTYDTSNGGRLTQSTDAGGNPTNYYYGSNSCGAFPDTVTPPISALQTTAVWNCTGAVMTSSTDPNGQTTTFTYDDPMNRLTETNYPDGGKKTIGYPSPNEIDTDIYGIGTSGLTQDDTTDLDSLGRVSSQTVAGVTTSATYDALGRVATESNASSGWSEQFNYDALGRVADTGTTKAITYADGNTESITYSGQCSTSTDEAGKSRKACSDALGRVISVTEDPTGWALQTTYTYDALNDLLTVVQGSQKPCANGTASRSFKYDYALAPRLDTACTPESGTTNYTYYTSGMNAGDLHQRTDARNITTTYQYDTMQRLTSKSYNDNPQTPTANYFYGDQTLPAWPAWTGVSFTYPNGRLILACTGSPSQSCTSPQAAVAFSYDQMGRVKDLWQCTPYNCGSSSIWNLHYDYDKAGDVNDWLNASGTEFMNTVNANQQITSITSSLNDSNHPGTLATLTYTGFNTINKLTDGCAGTGCTQTVESYNYNNRLQLTRVELGTSSNNNSYNCFVYNYYSSVTLPTGCALGSQGTGDNGNVVGYYYRDSSTVTQSHTAAFAYDVLNRLTSATGTPTGSGTVSYSQNYNYTGDGTSNGTYGNMSCTVGGSLYCPQLTFDASTNRLTKIGSTSTGIDAAGDMTSDGSNSYAWDAEQRLSSINFSGQCSTSTACYVYNALGQRAETQAGSAYHEFLYDPAGVQVGRSDRGSSFFWQYLMLGEQPFGKYQDGKTYFLHWNNLGSTSFVTDQTGTTIEDILYTPWGQQWSLVGTNKDQHFAKLWQDPESGLDHADHRKYYPNLGRWLSPDPVIITPERLQNPQQLNLYSYVQNNPLRYIDPTGEILQCVGSADQQKQCFRDLQQIAGDAASRLSMDAKTGVVSFDTKDLDLSKNEGAALVNDLVGSKNTYDFSIGPTVETANGPQKVDFITNLPAFGDQRQIGQPKAGVSDVVALFLNNPDITQVSNTNLKVALDYTVAFHELAEAFAKIDAGKGGSYEQGHNAALQREMILRDQRPYLKQYNTGAGGPANSPNPQGGIIIKR